MTLYLPLEAVVLPLILLSTYLVADVLMRNRVPFGWRAVLSIVTAIVGLVVAGYMAHAAPPDADWRESGIMLDPSILLTDTERAVVTSQGYTVTPTAFADSLNPIIMCESQNNPEAVNPAGGATGLLQLYPDSAMLRHVREHGYSWADVQDPWVNLWLGYRWWVRTGSTWSHWECRA